MQRAFRTICSLFAVAALVLVVSCASPTPAAQPTAPAAAPATAGAPAAPTTASAQPTTAPATQPTAAPQAAGKNVLVLGVDISDTRTLDPQRQFDYSPPITEHAIYETLVTMTPGDYTLKPLLATKWELSADGSAWVFHLRPNVKFVTGNPMTADDVKFSFDRLANLKDTPAALADNIAETKVVDPMTVEVVMKDKTQSQPTLSILISPDFGIVDSKTVKAQGGTSEPGADTADKATDWLNTHSVGTGPYQLTNWVRNSEIDLQRNPNYWRDPAPFERVIIRHIGDSAAQLLALQRGDVDAALNLTPEQLDTLKGQPNIKIVSGTSLDYVYMTLTSDDKLAPGLGKKEARQAVAAAIDYDGIIKGLIGGSAVRPPNFIPVGLGGSTEELTKQFGPNYNPDKAKQLLAAAGLPNGFSFDLSYANAAVAGVAYQALAQKVQSDLAAVNITVNLKPMDQTNLVTQYRAGDLASVMTFWNPDAIDPYWWASAAVMRVAKRVRWTVPDNLLKLVSDAASEQDDAKRNALYVEWQKQMVDQSNYIILLQPIYRVATRGDTITDYQLTAAGWQVDLYDIKPAK